MNRSILIVICDFLLVGLLTFSTVDINKTGQSGGPPKLQITRGPRQSSGDQVLDDVMRLALEDERKQRDQLSDELTRARTLVSQRDEQIRRVQDQLQSKQQLAAGLAQERAALQRQFANAQTNLASLSEQLHARSVETVISKEQRAAMEAEARKQSEEAAKLGKQLAQVQKTNQQMLSEQQALRKQLRMSQESNSSVRAQMAQLKEEVEVQRRENSRLADGVKDLASKSYELVREIRSSREQTPNGIFEEMSTNRVRASFSGLKSGLLGIRSAKDRQTQIILVTDETNMFVLCHVQDTPLALSSPGTQWEELSGTLEHGTAVIPIESLCFCMTDPRVVLIRVTSAEASALGCKVYHLAKDPCVFQDAVVVGTREDYYGECKFQIDVSTPQYLKMDHNSLKGLFGKFNPSSGDLVLSKTGELLGVMANSSYCAIIRNLEPAAVIRLGPEGRNQPTAQILSALYTMVADLPNKLQ